MEDLNRAVGVAGIAANTIPPDHPNRTVYFNNLRNLLRRRFERTRSMGNLNRALSCYEDGWASQGSPPSIRIVSARHGVNIFAS